MNDVRRVHLPHLQLPRIVPGTIAVGLAVACVVIAFGIVAVQVAMSFGGPSLPEPTFPASDWVLPSRIFV